MQSVVKALPSPGGALQNRRSIAIANIRWFRAMSWRALRDGGPLAEQRAANARAAARIVLRQARRDAIIGRMATQALGIDG